MYRRAQLSRAANQRYLEALASITGSNSLLQEAAAVCRPSTHHGKRYRALNALAQNDHLLLLACSRGEFALRGFRNAELRALLYPNKLKPTKAELRRRSAAVTRRLTLLRAHGLIQKLPHTHRYQISAKGRRIITALLAACYADVEQLTKLAALNFSRNVSMCNLSCTKATKVEIPRHSEGRCIPHVCSRACRRF